MTVSLDQCEPVTEQTQVPSQPVVSVVIPCLNEERTIADCVHRAIIALAELRIPWEVVVADNGSDDASVSVAERAGARVVNCSIRGYGSAIRNGVEHSRGEFIVVGDADGEHDLSCIGSFVIPLLAGADLVIGNRFAGGTRPQGMRWLNHYIGNPGLTQIMNWMFRVGIRDSQCGFRGFSRKAFVQMSLETPGMEFASEMLVKAVRRGLTIIEVPIVAHPSGRNRPPHLLPFRDGWRHLKFLLMFSPLHLFIIPGLASTIAGLILLLIPVRGAVQLWRVNFDIHWMALGLLLVLIGLQVIELGIIARLHTVTHRFPEPDPALEWFRSIFTLERGLAIGMFLFFVGFAIDSWILWEWLIAFKPLQQVRAAILATGLMAVGIQASFFSFLIEIVGSVTVRADVAQDSSSSSCLL